MSKFGIASCFDSDTYCQAVGTTFCFATCYWLHLFNYKNKTHILNQIGQNKSVFTVIYLNYKNANFIHIFTNQVQEVQEVHIFEDKVVLRKHLVKYENRIQLEIHGESQDHQKPRS